MEGQGLGAAPSRALASKIELEGGTLGAAVGSIFGY